MNACLIDEARAKMRETLEAVCEEPVTDVAVDEAIEAHLRELREMEAWKHRRFYLRHRETAEGLAFRLIEEFDTPHGRRQRTKGHLGVWRGPTGPGGWGRSWGSGEGIAEFWDTVGHRLGRMEGVDPTIICDWINNFIPPHWGYGTPAEMAARAREIKSTAERKGITLDEAHSRKQHRDYFWWVVRDWFTWEIFIQRVHDRFYRLRHRLLRSHR